VNYIDVYHRTGLYPVKLPSGLGTEGAGVVDAVGADVTVVKPGDRVAYAGGPLGAYAQLRVLPADRLVKLPRSIDDRTAAALMLKGLTAYYLLRKTWPVKSGDTVLVHAAAGGVGSILVPWARRLGATVIATVGSKEKAARALALGAQHVIEYRNDDFCAVAKKLTGGRGVDVVYDSVGKDTFMGSLDCLRPLGMMVAYGNASGKPPSIDPMLLTEKGSLFLTRPTLSHYIAHREDLLAAAKALFQVIRDGTVNPLMGQRYARAVAAVAHRDLEARKTMGSTILLP
jgi:NADPH2:quinone reductase